MLFNVVRKHLRTHTINLHRPAIKNRYLFCSNIFQDVGKVNHTKFRCVPVIWGNLILQDFNISELKRLPIIILLRIQNLSVIILPKYINNMDSRDSKQTNPDNSQSDHCSKPGTEDMERNFEVLQCQEAPHKAPLYRDKKARALSPDGQQDPLETPSKKIKVMGVTEAATTPEETMDKPKITDTVTEIDTYTSLDKGVKQNNIVCNATQHSLDHNKDKFFVVNEVSAIKMSNESDLIAPQDSSDSDNENEENPSQTETADIEIKQPDADLDYQPSPDASSSAAEANNNSAKSQNLQEIVVRETYDTKPIIDEQPKEDNHQSPAERQDLGITRSTFSNVSHTESPEQYIQRANAWPKDGHKMSLKGECKTPHNNRTSIPNCLNPQDIASLPTDSDTEANPERQIMNPEPPETVHNESYLDNDEARVQYNSLLQETTVSRRKIAPSKCVLIAIIIIGIIVCIMLVLYSTLIFKL